MPLPSPSPAATITVIELMPHAMPNIVSIVRRLWAHKVASVSRSKSWNDMALRGYLQLLQDDLLFLGKAEEDFGIGAHVGLELAAGIGNRDAHLEGRDVVLLLAERRNLGDLAGEFLVLKRFHNDARGLAEKYLPDVCFVDLALHVNFADVAQRHDQGGLRAQHQDGADRISDVHVARKHQSFNR